MNRPIKNLATKSFRRLVAWVIKFRGSKAAAERHEEPSNQIYLNFLSALIFLWFVSFHLGKEMNNQKHLK